MAFSKQEGHQDVSAIVVSGATFDELTSGTEEVAAVAPPDAVVVGGQLIVETAFDSGTSDVLDVGDEDDPDRYTSGTSIAATGVTDLTITGHVYDAVKNLTFTWTGSGTAATAGEFKLVFLYVRVGKADFTTG